MTSEDEPKAPDAKRKPMPVVVALPGEAQPPSVGQAALQVALQPSIKAAVTIQEYTCDLDLTELSNELSNQARALNEGDLKSAEGMLMIQAHTLDAIFNNLALRANRSERMDHFDRCLRLGLKAQSQCRATLETLATIKNPSVVFARQANIAQGPQQVNNGMMPAGEPRAGAGKTEKLNNELSGGSNELLPDTRTPALAGPIDPQMAAVGEIGRTEDAAR